MSFTQEPPAVEVLCYQCSGLGKLRITFGDPPQWAKCRKCCGTGKLQRSGGVFVGVLPDLSEVVREEKEAFGKRKFMDGASGAATGVLSSSPAIDEPVGQGREIDTPTIRFPDIQSAQRCNLCERKADMIHEGLKYCAAHGMEMLKAQP